jgi:uncharacterized protein
MLLIDIPRVPPEGLDLDEALDASALRLEGETEFELRPGARLKCHVELVDFSTLHVRGRFEGSLDTECARCLERYAREVGQALDLFYLPRAKDDPREQAEEVELSDHEVVVGYYDGDRLDLAEVMREQIVLGLPLKPLCREDCRGRCPSCGRNRNTEPCTCPPAEEPVDPRLAPLAKLFDKN